MRFNRDVANEILAWVSLHDVGPGHREIVITQRHFDWLTDYRPIMAGYVVSIAGLIVRVVDDCEPPMMIRWRRDPLIFGASA